MASENVRAVNGPKPGICIRRWASRNSCFVSVSTSRSNALIDTFSGSSEPKSGSTNPQSSLGKPAYRSRTFPANDTEECVGDRIPSCFSNPRSALTPRVRIRTCTSRVRTKANP